MDLTDEALQDLAAVARDADKLAVVLAAAEEVGPTVGLLEMCRAISAKTSLPLSETRRLAVWLLNFYQTQRKIQKDAVVTGEAITEEFERKARSEEEKRGLQLWKQECGKVVQAVSLLKANHPLIMSHKAGRVVYARPYLLREAKILTDVRPVFNSEGDAVTQVVVSHTLHVIYQEGGKDDEIHLSLDAVDIATLKRLCERAERKAKVIKEGLAKTEWPTTILQEPDASSEG